MVDVGCRKAIRSGDPLEFNLFVIWRHLNGEFILGARPLLMGILNVTPDSFSDGGKYLLQEQALIQAEKMIREGADILDVGGESTRPGADPVSESEELQRVIPIIESVRRAYPEVVLSIDTYKAEVAACAVAAGAGIINDVGAGVWDKKMPEVVKAAGAGYICMHSRGRPQDMQNNPVYSDVVAEVLAFLRERRNLLVSCGIEENRLVFDPGIGFGKRLEDNMQLLRQSSCFIGLGRPVLWGLSRKSFISKLLGVGPEERLAGGLSAYAALLRHPVPQIWRVHDVAEHAQLIRMWEEISRNDTVETTDFTEERV
jgi:dihydropteroate synthase